MIDLMRRLSELCPEWVSVTKPGRSIPSRVFTIRVQTGRRTTYLFADGDDIENAPAILAIVSHLFADGWEVVSTSYKEQDGAFSHNCELYRRLGEELCSGYVPTMTEAVLKAAVEAYGETGKEHPKA